MVGDNKILTVSYGAFSCTLEGFDDPFNTMKAIAEYFRDLAAGDRFFGAEPPQPDADMLHRIAEQTIRAQVNAEVADNGLILRQAEPGATPAPAPAPEQVEEVTPAERFGANTVAEKLQRIRAVVANEATRPAYVEEDYSEDTAPAAFVAPEIKAVDDNDDEIDLSSVMEDTDTSEDEADAEAEAQAKAEEEARAQAEAEAKAEEEARAAAEAEAKAEEEARIAAEKAEEEARAQAEAEAKAEEEARAEAEAKAKAEEEARAQAEAEAKAEEEARAAAEEEARKAAEAEAKAEEEARAAAEAAAKAEEEAREKAEAEAKAEEEARAEAEAQAKAEEEARAQAEAEAKAEEEARAAAEAEAAEVETDDTDVAASDEASDEIAEDENEAEFEEPLPTPRRRIVVQKISRNDLSQPQPVAEDASNDDELSPEAEAALMRELADLEAETIDSAEETEATDQPVVEDGDAAEDAIAAALEAEEDQPVVDEVSEDAETDEPEVAKADVAEEYEETSDEVEAASDEADEDDQEAARAARLARRSIETEDEEAALERLMNVTSSRLDNDESSVRRASIAHLKAAVAATKADSTLAEEAAAEEERELDQYRDDLARVVKPGRARPRSDSSTSRPRPAPLVLVSEQRVDRPETDAPAIAATADVRPRRISHGNLALQEELEEEAEAEDRAGNIFGDEEIESFGEYAARHSALELPDMLEAAAAHYTWVEDQPQFTRPMLMRKIASISDAHAVSREDGLRAFGTLLRQGAIVKDGNGKFAIAATSRFAPEAQSDDA